MDDLDYLGALRADSAALAAAARLGLDPPVPACPGWSVADLVLHTGHVQRHKATIVRERLRRPPQATDFPAAPSPDRLIDWFEEGAADLAATLERADPAMPVWTFHNPDQTVGFWRRRMAHEAAVHRADAQSAHGQIALATPPELARDGVAEVLDVMLARLRDPRGGNGETVHLHCTDTEGEWLLTLEPDRVRVSLGHARGDCAARGSASDLLPFLWGRLPAERLEVFGDARLLARVRQLAAQATQ
jgi:uncharacterized protein (TIGR03083 family)